VLLLTLEGALSIQMPFQFKSIMYNILNSKLLWIVFLNGMWFPDDAVFEVTRFMAFINKTHLQVCGIILCSEIHRIICVLKSCRALEIFLNFR